MEKITTSKKSKLLSPSIGGSLLIGKGNSLENEIIKKTKIEIEESGRLTIVFSCRQHYEYTKDSQPFLIGMLVSVEGLPEEHDVMYYRILGEKQGSRLFFNWKKDKEEAEKKRRNEKEAKLSAEKDERELESARLLKGEEFANRLKEERKNKNKNVKKSRGIMLYAPNAVAFMGSSMTRIQNLVLNRVIKALQPYITKAIENKVRGVEERIMPPEGHIDVQFPLSELSCKSEYDKVEKEVLELKNTYIAYNYSDEEGVFRKYLNLFESVDVPIVSKSKMVEVRTTMGLTELLCNPFLSEGIEEKDKDMIINGFFSYQNNVLVYVRSRITQRVYLWLSSFKNTNNNKVVFSVAKIRSMLSLEEKYGNWSDFKKRILDDTQRELDENSYRFDLSFNYTPKYHGGTTGFPDEIEFEIIDNRETERYNTFKKEIEGIYDYFEKNSLSGNQSDKLTVLIDSDTLPYAKEEIRRIKEAIGQGPVRNKAAFIYKTFKSNMEKHIKNKQKKKSENIQSL